MGTVPSRESTWSVACLPGLLSPNSRNRVRSLSPKDRNQMSSSYRGRTQDHRQPWLGAVWLPARAAWEPLIGKTLPLLLGHVRVARD